MPRIQGRKFTIRNSFMHFQDSDSEGEDPFDCQRGRRSTSTPAAREKGAVSWCTESVGSSVGKEFSSRLARLNKLKALSSEFEGADGSEDSPRLASMRKEQELSPDCKGQQRDCASFSRQVTMESLSFSRQPTMELEMVGRQLTQESLSSQATWATWESLRSSTVDSLRTTCTLSPCTHHSGAHTVDALEPYRAQESICPLSPRSLCGESVWGRDEAFLEEQQTDEEEVPSHYTSVMLRNIPFGLTRDMLTDLLDREGFAGKYDFIYVPIHWATARNFGYLFLNLVSNVDAVHFKRHFTDFEGWAREPPSAEPSCVDWCIHFQGLQANIERYRNSPVMHRALPDHLKPALFKDGQRIAFPEPSKAVRLPRKRKMTKAVAGK